MDLDWTQVDHVRAAGKLKCLNKQVVTVDQNKEIYLDDECTLQYVDAENAYDYITLDLGNYAVIDEYKLSSPEEDVMYLKLVTSHREGNKVVKVTYKVYFNDFEELKHLFNVLRERYLYKIQD